VIENPRFAVGIAVISLILPYLSYISTSGLNVHTAIRLSVNVAFISGHFL